MLSDFVCEDSCKVTRFGRSQERTGKEGEFSTRRSKQEGSGKTSSPRDRPPRQLGPWQTDETREVPRCIVRLRTRDLAESGFTLALPSAGPALASGSQVRATQPQAPSARQPARGSQPAEPPWSPRDADQLNRPTVERQ